MNYKQLLKFYFCADSLNAALDDVALRYALKSADCFKDCEYYAARICDVIGAKQSLAQLYAFLDGALSSVTAEDRRALLAYCLSDRRRGARAALTAGGGVDVNRACAQKGQAGGTEEGERATSGKGEAGERAAGGGYYGGEGGKALHRALMKFSRRVSGRLKRFAPQIKLLGEYYWLLRAAA